MKIKKAMQVGVTHHLCAKWEGGAVEGNLETLMEDVAREGERLALGLGDEESFTRDVEELLTTARRMALDGEASKAKLRRQAGAARRALVARVELAVFMLAKSEMSHAFEGLEDLLDAYEALGVAFAQALDVEGVEAIRPTLPYALHKGEVIEHEGERYTVVGATPDEYRPRERVVMLWVNDAHNSTKIFKFHEDEHVSRVEVLGHHAPPLMTSPKHAA